MSIASELSQLNTNKTNIKAAIIGKNPTVSPTDNLSQWPTSIGSIVELKGQTRAAYPSTSRQIITPTSGKNGITRMTIFPVTSSIDANIIASNIKKDVSILGVTGTYEGSGGGGSEQGYTVTVSQYNGDYPTALTCFKTDGTSQVVSGGTVNDVVYVGFEVGGTEGTGAGGWESSNVAHNVVHGVGASWNSGGTGITYIHLTQNTSFLMNGMCLLKGTMISISNGKSKPIEEIDYDDELLCWDFDNGKHALAKPFWIKRAEKNTFYWINKFESGKEIRTTGTVAGHRFFNIGKGKFLYNTECVGDLCYTKDGPDRLIVAKYVEGECEFYNIYTNYHMNLFANGILTGFRYNNLYPIKDMKFVKGGRSQRSREEFKSIPDSWFYGMRCAEQTDSVEEITSYVLSREIIKK